MIELDFMQLQQLMIQKKKTLILAESCTGGLISHLITKHAGSSKYFLGSLVTYSNELKQKVLSVSPELLLEFGAVSLECVIAMVEGLLALSGADICVAVSGIAGPDGGSLENPVGTVFISILQKGQLPEVNLLHLEGDREKIMKAVSDYVLRSLYQKMQNEPSFSLS